jgi:protein-disulfide isomerase/uncharacterized membrane protein
MKKFIYPLLALAIAGAFISGMLLLQHYYPEAKIGVISCGKGIINPCLTLAQSGYATLFKIPIAAYGLFWYLLAIFILLIADYAGGRYHAYSLAILLPLSAAGVAADAVLGILLIKLEILCPFCVATYLVNIGVLAMVILWYRHAKKNENFSLPGTYRELISADSSPDRKAFHSAFILFFFLLGFAVFATSHILNIKTETVKIPENKTAAFLQNFYNSPVEKISFPDSGITLGNPNAELTIVAFTDFLCSACFKFYQEELRIFSKYRDRVKTVYYNYPLDMGCNHDVKRTVYNNSCIASRAFLAASERGIVEEYIMKHFADYENTHSRYTMELALGAFNKIDGAKRGGLNAAQFQSIMNSPGVTARLDEHLRLAKQFKVDATPTLYIGGRRLVGVPPSEVLDQIILNELNRKK